MKDYIKDGSFICIQAFMVKELHLKGIDLLIYAIIHGFSQDGKSMFTGSLAYLAQWTGASRSTVMRSLSGLVERGLLQKKVEDVNGVTFCRYKAVRDVDNSVDNVDNSTCAKNAHTGQMTQGVSNRDRGGIKMTLGGCQNDTGGGVKMIPNNIDNNLDYKLEDNTNTVFSHEAEFAELWELYPKERRQGKKEALTAYIRSRKKGASYEVIRAGLEAYKRKLEAERTESKYIMQAVTFFRGERWQDDYTIAPQRQAKQGYMQHSYTEAELRRMIDLGEDVYASD